MVYAPGLRPRGPWVHAASLNERRWLGDLRSRSHTSEGVTCSNLNHS
jgi:hypothetical protein